MATRQYELVRRAKTPISDEFSKATRTAIEVKFLLGNISDEKAEEQYCTSDGVVLVKGLTLLALYDGKDADLTL